MVGFVGANGAGKTTTMRIIATLDYPTRGTVRIGGIDVLQYPAKVRSNIGWMPDNFGTYDHMTVVEYLDFFARALGYRGEERLERVEDVMEFTDLASLGDRLINKLSKGMGQRLCLGRALIHDPDLLILDEPAAGLDPKARVELKHLIRILAEDGKTVFISSHILSELGEMCDTLLFIDQGKIIHHGSADSPQAGRRRCHYRRRSRNRRSGKTQRMDRTFTARIPQGNPQAGCPDRYRLDRSGCRRRCAAPNDQ